MEHSAILTLFSKLKFETAPLYCISQACTSYYNTKVTYSITTRPQGTRGMCIKARKRHSTSSSTAAAAATAQPHTNAVSTTVVNEEENNDDDETTRIPTKHTNGTKGLRNIHWSELKQHTGHADASSSSSSSSSSSKWIAIHGTIYDITQFVNVHPGGQMILSAYAGRNASDEFDAFHHPRVKRRLPALCIGTLVHGTGGDKAKDTDTADINTADKDQYSELASTRDYRQLRTKLWKEGWFTASKSYYVKRDLLALSILCLGIAIVAHGTTTFIRIGVGGMLVGLAIQQIAFVAHDAGHQGCGVRNFNVSTSSTTKNTSTSSLMGGMLRNFNWMGWFHGCVCFGVSIRMWTDEHSRHHAYTMRPREDPQFNYLPIFLVSEKELAPDKLKDLMYLERLCAQWLVPFQHLTFIPISVLIGRFNLHIISIIYALKTGALEDLVGLALYFTWFGSVVQMLPPSGYERLLFVLIAYCTAGILHVQLTISHLATEALTPEEDEVAQFFAFQCRTTRNIDSHWYNGWFHGGLEYQLEHHLFPQLPRHKLALVKPLVMDLCRKHNVPYRTTGFWSAVRECLVDVHRMRHFMDSLVYPDEILPPKVMSS
jgi:delta8-fatty-acid desaturase